MQLHQLELFCEVAKDEHMTKTAERLHISQPALTKTVRNLEQEIGVKLFVRTGRNIRLNDNGKFFYDAVSHALSDIQAALEELKQRELSESPAITVINQISEHFGNIFEDFHERYPGSSVWENLSRVLCKLF